MSTRQSSAQSDVWAKVDQLLKQKGAVAPSQVDGAFSLELYYPDFAQRIRAIRQRYWNSPEPPFPDNEEGEQKRKQFVENLNWRQKGMAPEEAEEDRDRFNGELWRLTQQYTVTYREVEAYLFFGRPPRVPPLQAVVRRDNTGPSYLELRILSSQVTPEQVRRFYEQVVSQGVAPQLFYDRAGKNGAATTEELVRSWALLCLTRRGRLGLDAAVKAWNQRYPKLTVDLATARREVRNARYRADGVALSVNGAGRRRRRAGT